MLTAIFVLFLFDMCSASVSIPAFVYTTLAILKCISMLLNMAVEDR